MKLISLNIWGGKIYEPLLDFFKKYSREVDIFCLQEVLHTPQDKEIFSELETVKIFSKIDSILADFTGYHAPILAGWTSLEMQTHDEVYWGLATFIKKNIIIDSLGDFFVYGKFGDFRGEPKTIPRNIQYIRFKTGAHSVTVCNFHGYWEPHTEKADTPERMVQSKKIVEFLDQEKSNKILCGDFNLAPYTQSLKILESNMRNLIKEYGITSTRSSYYSKDMKFADYILVSPNIKVRDFKVLPDEVSDHLPLYLEFE